jgi:hypothetical protein
VALGFEMPLFAPIPADPSELGKARASDKGRARVVLRSGSERARDGLRSPGSLKRLHERVPAAPVHFRWELFEEAQSCLLWWEALVMRDAKARATRGRRHRVEALCAQLPTPGDPCAHKTEHPISLVAALAQRARWDGETDDFRSACVLVRAQSSG